MRCAERLLLEPLRVMKNRRSSFQNCKLITVVHRQDSSNGVVPCWALRRDGSRNVDNASIAAWMNIKSKWETNEMVMVVVQGGVRACKDDSNDEIHIQPISVGFSKRELTDWLMYEPIVRIQSLYTQEFPPLTWFSTLAGESTTSCLV